MLLDIGIRIVMILLEDCRFDRDVVVLSGVIGIGTVLIYHIFFLGWFLLICSISFL